jgi:OOP family OmpA-OmpF porin
MSLRIVALLIAATFLSACASLPEPKTCALIGAGAGAVAGGVGGAEYAEHHDDGHAVGIGIGTLVGGALLGYVTCALLREEPEPPAQPAAPTPPPPAPIAKAPEPEPVVDVCSGVIRLRGVEFEFDSAQLTPVSSVVLDAAVEGLKECPDIAVRVEGHTDAIGAEAYNQTLGLQRADSVKRYLVGGGVAEMRITTRSYGESRPVASNDTEDGRILNRRVELHTGGDPDRRRRSHGLGASPSGSFRPGSAARARR